jgi:hypothetical protein
MERTTGQSGSAFLDGNKVARTIEYASLCAYQAWRYHGYAAAIAGVDRRMGYQVKACRKSRF